MSRPPMNSGQLLRVYPICLVVIPSMFIILVTSARPLEARFLCRDVFGSPAMV